LISTIYDNATGTHPQATVNPCHLAAGTFTQLRLSAVAISTEVLMTYSARTPTVPSTCVRQRSAPVLRRYFGREMRVSKLSLAGVDHSPISTSPVRLRFFNGRGQPVGRAIVYSGRPVRVVTFGGTVLSPLAAGFEVTSATGVRVGNTTVVPQGSTGIDQLDSNFQLAIDSSKWHLTSTQEQFSVFKARSIRPEAWLSKTARGHVTKIRDASWGDTWVSVSLSSPAELYRSEAYLPGWRATALNMTTGKTTSLSVQRSGLIEEIDVPAGNWTIHFHYHAPYIELSTTASTVSWLLLLGVGGTWVLRRARKRNGKVLA
jgi:hypothetical protein